MTLNIETFDPEAPLGPKVWSTGPVDDRRRVRNTLVSPLNSICRLSAPGPLMGSGTVIGRRAILTAGHNLTGTVETDWAIDPAYNKVPQLAPLRGRSKVPHPAWRDRRDPHFDLGVIILEGDAENWFTPTVCEDATPDSKIYVSGYSLDDPNFQRFDTGDFSQGNGSLAGHTCDTAPGQSGSPVIAFDQHGSRVIGVHVYGYNELTDVIPGRVNKAVLLTSEIFDWLRDVLRDEGGE